MSRQDRFALGGLVLAAGLVVLLVWFSERTGPPPAAAPTPRSQPLVRAEPAPPAPLAVPEQAAAEPSPVASLSSSSVARVAIIMDDLGRSFHAAQTLLSFAEPVAFSILPGESQAAAVAEMAHLAGREVLLHLPMEPRGYPEINPGHDALLLSQTDDEIERRIDGFLQRVPYAVGVNNHMGSRFTEDRRAMTTVMQSVHRRGLFMVDSLTTGRSVVVDVARELRVPWQRRDVFLDNVAEVEAIAEQVALLVAKARRHGMAIGLCHPYPETLQALGRELPLLAERGVKVVPVATLLRRD
ncbi:MAG: divergent polysaccharide deacetylase family protein [Desulfuromonadales bacterium]|nr:divergent polysaccharide deacetylase family protein [Desulfuromonadales bacterium]